MISDIGIFLSVVDVYGGAKGYTLVQTSAPTKATTHSSGTIDLMLSNTTIKDECANLMVEISMEGATLILVQ
jgi:hypothetical protein